MKRKLLRFATALTLLAGLAGCDKCGDFQQLRFPGQPKTCSGDAGR